MHRLLLPLFVWLMVLFMLQRGAPTAVPGGGCGDNSSFVDALGSACSEWAGYDCGDEVQAAGWGYTANDTAAVRFACPLSCASCFPQAANTNVSLAWSAVPRHGASPPPLREMTLLSRLLPSGVRQVVLWGGNSGVKVNSDLYLLRTDTFRWTKQPVTTHLQPVARTQHASALQANRFLIICGGADSKHYLLNDVWRLDLDSRYA